MAASDDLRSTLRNGALLSSVVWIEAAAALVYLLAINRLLGPADYGLWSFAVASYVIVIAVISLGFESVVQFAYGGDRERGDATVAAALFWRLTLSAAACIAFAAFALSRGPLENAGAATALLLIAPAIIGRSVANLSRAILVGRSNVALAVPVSLSLRGGEAIAAVTLLLLGAPLTLLIAMHALTWSAEGVLLFKRVAGPGAMRAFGPSWTSTKMIARAGAPRAIISALLTIMVSAPLILFAPLAAAPEQVGFLAIVVQVTTMALWTGQTFINASSPSLASRHARNEKTDRGYEIWTGAAAIALFAALAVGLAFFGEELFISLLGAEFGGLAQLMIAGCLFGAFQLAPNGLQQAWLARERYAPGIIANGLGCATMFVGFQLAPEGTTTANAIWIISAAWAARLFAMIAFALLERGD